MAELLDVVTAFPASLKAAWIAWLVWGVVLAGWYRYARRLAVPVAMPSRRPLPPRPPRRVPRAAPEPRHDTQVEPADHGQAPSPSAGDPPESAHPGEDAPASQVA